VIIKDHLSESGVDHLILRFMDWFGNAPNGVTCPGRYLGHREWTELFAALELCPIAWCTDLGLYPWPFSAVFGRGLHFTTRLERAG
jgi:hypothetical protein